MERADRSRRLLAAAKSTWPWWLIAGLGAFLGTRHVLKGFSDFSVSLRAAEELSLGIADVYRLHDDVDEVFGYPHAVLLPLLGLLQLVSPRCITLLFGLSQGLATLLLARDLRRLFPAAGWAAALTFVVLFGRVFENNWRNGQPALWCGVLVTHGIWRLVQARPRAGGICLAGAALLKLTPGLFLPALLAARQFRGALWLGGSAACAALVLPIPFLGWELHYAALRCFGEAMLLPFVDPERGATVVWHAHSWSIGGALGWLPRPVRMLWSLLVLLLLVAGWRRRTLLRTRLALVTLAMVLYSPLTRVHHLALAAVPLFAFCAEGPGRGRARGLWFATAGLLLVAMPLRQKSLLGEALWRQLDEWPVGHLGLVGVLLWTVVHAAPTVPACPATPNSSA